MSKIPYELADELKLLKNCTNQRFYMNDGSNAKSKSPSTTSDNIFINYTDIKEEFKVLVIQENKPDLEDVAKKWMEIFKEK